MGHSSEKLFENDLNDIIDRLVELQDEINVVRKEAKLGNFSPFVINWLVNAKSNYPGDNGAEVLNELIKCAEILGIKQRNETNLSFNNGLSGDPCQKMNAENENKLNQDNEPKNSFGINRLNKRSWKKNVIIIFEIFLGIIISLLSVMVFH